MSSVESLKAYRGPFLADVVVVLLGMMVSHGACACTTIGASAAFKAVFDFQTVKSWSDGGSIHTWKSFKNVETVTFSLELCKVESE